MKNLIFSCIFIASSACHAQVTGNSLYNLCNDADKSTLCLMYIGGYYDGFRFAEDSHESLNKSRRLICIPGAVQNRQLWEVGIKYINEHPAERHLPADQLLAKAISQHYACTKK